MRHIVLPFIVVSCLAGQFANSTGSIAVLGIRVSFQPDGDESTTGDGTFLTEAALEPCGDYSIDRPPHNRTYFETQLRAVDSYFRSASVGSFGIDLGESRIFPLDESGSYSLDTTMAYFHPFGDEALQDRRLAEFFRASLTRAYQEDSLSFGSFDVIVIFHAGIGQDFALPFLDPTPEDINSAYVDSDFLTEQLGEPEIIFAEGNSVSSGIILPETQNHLFYDISDQIFLGISNPCDYQFGLTGTFALMLGFAIGLPPLWNTESGESGVGVFALMDQGSNNGRGVVPSPPDAWTRTHAGWEVPTVVRPTNTVDLMARDSVPDQIVRIDITPSEYFLIENRNNWVVNGVDIDSMRWRNRRQKNGEVIVPSYLEMLMDSGGVDIDSVFHVVTSVPNYDLGLPGSGLIIWHVDEQKINEGLVTYSVNGDREHRGIDLEEADGAQDIGYPLIFLFTDPTSGLWSDMWFSGNSEYYLANPGFKGQPPSFGHDTFPNTRSNKGSDTYIQIDGISKAGNIMSFTVDNSLMASGFPDTSLHIHFLYDFSRDGKPELIGGLDSLWWSDSDSLSRVNFFELPSNSFQLAVTNYESTAPALVAVMDLGNEVLRVSAFTFENDNSGFVLEWDHHVSASGLPKLSSGFPDSVMVVLNWGPTEIIVTGDSVETVEQIPGDPDPSRTVVAEMKDLESDSSEVSIISIQEQGGLLVEHEGSIAYGMEQVDFRTIGAVDLDLDGKIEITGVDTEGRLYVINRNFTVESGFPIFFNVTSPVLAQDLLGDGHPELVAQVDSSDIVVVDWQGNELYRLANPRGSQLRMLSHYLGRNCIAAESAIWLFDRTSTSGGNRWAYVHHDPTNRRRFQGTSAFRAPPAESLMDAARTYNYPNPTQDNSTTLRVYVGSAEKVEILIYDVAGFYLDRLSMESPVQGEVNEIAWDVSAVDSGVYFANVIATRGSRSESKILKIAVVH
ncbi:MAG: T9SS type A sorting domain-containing protein [Candidatus Neomarinimicrobiota bacterium]